MCDCAAGNLVQQNQGLTEEISTELQNRKVKRGNIAQIRQQDPTTTPWKVVADSAFLQWDRHPTEQK